MRWATRFTADDRVEWAHLKLAVLEATAALETFEKSRQKGQAPDILKAGQS